MPNHEDFIRELFSKLKALNPELYSPYELYYVIYDTCGEWLEKLEDSKIEPPIERTDNA